jgi:hypothetical protein
MQLFFFNPLTLKVKALEIFVTQELLTQWNSVTSQKTEVSKLKMTDVTEKRLSMTIQITSKN